MNIILDLDGTLIDAQYPAGAKAAVAAGVAAPRHVCGKRLANLHIYKRPGLDDFLEFCFDNFANVGLWTHSGKEWVDEVLTNVIETTSRYNWSFIFTGERATRVACEQGAAQLSAEMTYPKDLKKVYRRKDLRAMGFERYNTIIVEDTPGNCWRNYGNAIYVSSYDVVRKFNDRELPLLQKYLEHTILGCHNVRAIEKRHWKSEVLKREESNKIAKKRQRRDTKCFWMQENWQSYLNVTVNAPNQIQCISAYTVQ